MLDGTLSTSPAQFTTMFVNKTKTTLRAHTVDKNTSSVCRSKRRFRPKPHAPVLFLSIYRDTYHSIVTMSELISRNMYTKIGSQHDGSAFQHTTIKFIVFSFWPMRMTISLFYP